MTPAEIQAVQEAKQADVNWWPDGLVWAKSNVPGEPLWCWDCSDFVLDPADDEDGSEEWKRAAIPFEDRIEGATLPLEADKAAVVIRDALHRRILERFARVAAQASGGFRVILPDHNSTPTESSLIVCMARAVIALQESPDA